MRMSNFIKAMGRGWQQICPQCAGSPLFRSYLKAAENCKVCQLDYQSMRSDDVPAYFTIAIVGHIILPAICFLEIKFSPSLTIHLLIWPGVTTILVLMLLPRIKGMIMSMLWYIGQKGS